MSRRREVASTLGVAAGTAASGKVACEHELASPPTSWPVLAVAWSSVALAGFGTGDGTVITAIVSTSVTVGWDRST